MPIRKRFIFFNSEILKTNLRKVSLIMLPYMPLGVRTNDDNKAFQSEEGIYLCLGGDII